jgi:hypothetical protein
MPRQERKPWLWMRARGEDGRPHRRGVGSAVFSPQDEPLRCPFGLGLMGARPVFGQRGRATALVGTDRRGDANTSMESFHGVGRQPHLQFLFDQLIRDRIRVTGHLHVIIDRDLGLASLRVGITFCGQGAPGRTVERFEQLLPTTG